MGRPFEIDSTVKQKLPCPICESTSHWRWMDTHGVAICEQCNCESVLLESALNDKGTPLPNSCLKSEWFPRYRKWWQETTGKTCFNHWWVQNGGEPPERRPLPAGYLYHDGCTDPRPKISLVQPGMFWGNGIGTWQCHSDGCHVSIEVATWVKDEVQKKPGSVSYTQFSRRGLLIEAEVAVKLNATHDKACPYYFEITKDNLYYVPVPG